MKCEKFRTKGERFRMKCEKFRTGKGWKIESYPQKKVRDSEQKRDKI